MLAWIAGIALLFIIYAWGLSKNPPGFYVDESALAYNAYLLAHTGAGEFRPRFPLYFEMFTNGFTQYVSPTQVYFLALVFRLLPPSILIARIFSAFWVFSACLLLGLLAARISANRGSATMGVRALLIGIIVTGMALLTPWFYDIRGLLLEPHFVPMALLLFLLAAHHASGKEPWTWIDVGLLVASLALLTYCYQSGRLLGALLAFGLLLLATTKQCLVGVLKVWFLFGLTLLPMFAFNREHPAALVRRLYEISYVRPGVPWRDIASEFVRRYLEDQGLYALLMTGDYHPRHHVQGSGGAIFLATFILAMIGLLLVCARGWRDPWWRFVLYGLAVSIIPGAITIEPFHQLRLLAYPVFLLLLTVPALEWLLASHAAKESGAEGSHETLASQQFRGTFGGVSRPARLCILFLLLGATVLQAARYQTVFRRDGPKREYEFDVPYKAVYDAAVAQPTRPIYLQDGKWGPAYIHALWYATIEGRPKSEFVHLPDRGKAPRGSVVISSAENCQNCEIIKRNGVYFVYRVK